MAKEDDIILTVIYLYRIYKFLIKTVIFTFFEIIIYLKTPPKIVHQASVFIHAICEMKIQNIRARSSCYPCSVYKKSPGITGLFLKFNFFVVTVKKMKFGKVVIVVFSNVDFRFKLAAPLMFN